MSMAGFPPGQSICTQVDQPSCTYPQLLPSTGRHGGRVAVRKPDKETQGDDQCFSAWEYVAAKRCGGGGECSLEHTVQTAVAVVDLVG